jgi:Protein of unknown function (DUF3108)
MKNLLPLSLFIILSTSWGAETPPWADSLTTGKGPGAFPFPPNSHLTYRFGWSGITAAQADVRLKSEGNLVKTRASGGTTGLARVLFRLDLDHECLSHRSSLLPTRVVQDEKYASEDIKTTIDFTPKGTTSTRDVTPSKEPPKSKTLEFAPIFSFETAYLWLRSQPLTDGEKEVMVVYANNAAYLATMQVVGREKIRVADTERNAIKINLNFKTVDQNLQLKTYRRFKSGRGWISDDNYRIPLRVEADIFIGYVFAELQSFEPVSTKTADNQ